MAFTATLKFGNNGNYNKEYLITDVRCHFSRNCSNNQPTSAARCESIKFTVAAPDKTDLSFYDWYVSMDMRSGCIVFEQPVLNDAEKATKELLFENAVCFSMSEVYDRWSENRRMLNVAFEAEKIDFNGIEFEHL